VSPYLSTGSNSNYLMHFSRLRGGGKERGEEEEEKEEGR